MVTLKQIKPIFNFIEKNTKSMLRNIMVNANGMIAYDFETMILIKDNYGLRHGFQEHSTLGLLDSFTTDEDDYPLMDLSVEGSKVTMSLGIIESLLPFASKDETRIFLNGIAINAGHFVATDGCCLKAIKVESELECIIPATSLKILVRLLKLYKIKDSFDCSVNDEYFTVSNEHFTFKARLIQRDFAKWQAVIPRAYISEMHIVEWIDYKELKPLFNMKSSCSLECKEGKVILNIIGRDKSYVVGHCEPEMNEVLGFNVTYIERAAAGSRSFKIKFNNALASTEINEAIVMPLRL